LLCSNITSQLWVRFYRWLIPKFVRFLPEISGIRGTEDLSDTEFFAFFIGRGFKCLVFIEFLDFLRFSLKKFGRSFPLADRNIWYLKQAWIFGRCLRITAVYCQDFLDRSGCYFQFLLVILFSPHFWRWTQSTTRSSGNCWCRQLFHQRKLKHSQIVIIPYGRSGWAWRAFLKNK